MRRRTAGGTEWSKPRERGLSCREQRRALLELQRFATAGEFAAIVGPLAQNFAGLAFRGDGVLFAISGDGAATPETLWTISTATAQASVVQALGNGSDGETIAFAPDGFLYHASGLGLPNVDEVFEREPHGAFVPRQTVRDPLFVHPNAVVAVGARQFYLANDTGRPQDSAPVMDALLRRGHSTVVYFDGEKSRVVASGLRFVAGLAASPDGQRVYVGEALGERLRVYRRDVASGDLTLERVVGLGTAPDNLNVDADGVVWIAAHPKLFAFLAHVKDPARRAPTQVLRYDPRDGKVTGVYESDGAPLSAGSVAAHWRDGFLIGGVLDHQVLICKTPA